MRFEKETIKIKGKDFFNSLFHVHFLQKKECIYRKIITYKFQK